MNFSPALLFAVAAASDDKMVPPRRPLLRLNYLLPDYCVLNNFIITDFTEMPLGKNHLEK